MARVLKVLVGVGLGFGSVLGLVYVWVKGIRF